MEINQEAIAPAVIGQQVIVPLAIAPEVNVLTAIVLIAISQEATVPTVIGGAATAQEAIDQPVIVLMRARPEGESRPVANPTVGVNLIAEVQDLHGAAAKYI